MVGGVSVSRLWVGGISVGRLWFRGVSVSQPTSYIFILSKYHKRGNIAFKSKWLERLVFFIWGYLAYFPLCFYYKLHYRLVLSTTQ